MPSFFKCFVSEKLESIDRKLDLLLQETNKMALDITALQTAVANETTVDQSAITLISGIAAQLKALVASSGNTVDPAAVTAIVTQLTANQAALAAAITANTPAS